MTTNAETLQFTEGQIRAFGNALDRAKKAFNAAMLETED